MISSERTLFTIDYEQRNCSEGFSHQSTKQALPFSWGNRYPSAYNLEKLQQKWEDQGYDSTQKINGSEKIGREEKEKLK